METRLAGITFEVRVSFKTRENTIIASLLGRNLV